MSRPLHAFLIAGEPSGDALGGALMAGLRLERDVRFSGVGGPAMAEQGLKSLFPMEDLSVMGLLEVLPRIPRILRRIRQTAEAIVAARPDVLVTIDSPDFCLRVAARARAALPGLKVVHYVAPSVWAWRPERAQKMAAHVDHVLALLPFEPPLMEAAGMSCDFVGHPVVAEPAPDAAAQAALRAELGLGAAPVICLLPGSRRGEIRRLMPVFEAVVHRLARARPELRFVLPAAGAVAAEVEARAARWPARPALLDPRGRPVAEAEARKRAAFALSSAALASSGTVALELAAADCPMVVAYKANWATTRMVKRLARIDTANLVNILTESRVVPEFLFERCQAEEIAPALLGVLEAPQAQQTAFARALDALGRGGTPPGLRAARSVLEFLERASG